MGEADASQEVEFPEVSKSFEAIKSGSKMATDCLHSSASGVLNDESVY